MDENGLAFLQVLLPSLCHIDFLPFRELLCIVEERESARDNKRQLNREGFVVPSSPASASYGVSVDSVMKCGGALKKVILLCFHTSLLIGCEKMMSFV